MSRKRTAQAILGAAALYGLSRPGKSTIMAKTRSNTTNREQGLMDSKKSRKYKDKDDNMALGETMLGGSQTSIGVDRDALPREKKEIADKMKPILTKARKDVEKKRKEGKLSPTMTKRKNQISNDNFAFGLQAKTGKMVKARGGGMARMKPTKLY